MSCSYHVYIIGLYDILSHEIGKDELHPVSKRGDGGYHMGLTIIDALDTIIIMGNDCWKNACEDHMIS